MITQDMLTSKALDSNPVAEVDGKQRTQDFILSQRRYVVDHARDGKKYFSSLIAREGSEASSLAFGIDGMACMEAKTSKPSLNPPAAVFSSPILKPRVPEEQSVKRKATSHKRSTKDDNRHDSSCISISTRSKEPTRPVSHHSEQDEKENDEHVLRTFV